MELGKSDTESVLWLWETALICHVIRTFEKLLFVYEHACVFGWVFSSINNRPPSHHFHTYLPSDTQSYTHKNNGHSHGHNACRICLYLNGHALYIMLQVSKNRQSCPQEIVGWKMCAEYPLPSKWGIVDSSFLLRWNSGLRMTRTDVFFFWCRGKYKSISNNFHLPQVLCRSPLQLLKGLKWNLGTDLVHVIQRIRPYDLGDHQSHTSCATMRLTSVDIFFLTMTTIFP